MKQCRICDDKFHPEYGAEIFCSKKCRDAVDTSSGDIDRARIRYQIAQLLDFNWQWFALNKPKGEENTYK